MSNKKLSQIFINNYSYLISFPNTCPHCNASIFPILETHTNIKYDEPFNTLAVVFSCPKCDAFFTEIYSDEAKLTGEVRYSDENFCSIKYKSEVILDKEIPESIQRLFSNFCTIYSQSLTAEYHGLSEIVGIGLRKSIEFLVKDYLIQLQNYSASDVETLPLMQAINKIDDTRIKNLTKTITWLGNDETHYVKKHIDRDVSDIKRFIKALYRFVADVIDLKDAESIKAK